PLSTVADANVTGQAVDVVLVTAGTAQGPGTIVSLPVTVAAGTTTSQTISVSNVTAIDPSNVPITAANTPVNGTVNVGPGGNGVSIAIGAVTGKPGENITLPVTLASASAVGAVRVRLCSGGALKFTGVDFTGSTFASPDVDDFNLSADGSTLDVVLVS